VELVINRELTLNENQIALLEMHSVFNIANILIEEFKLIQKICGENINCDQVIQHVNDLKNHLTDREKTLNWLSLTADYIAKIRSLIKITLKKETSLGSNLELEKAIQNLFSVLDVLDTRAREILSRKKDPYIWIDHEVYALKQNFIDMLTAFQVNAKGKYKITDKVESKEDADYLVEFTVVNYSSDEIINMPAALQDCIRDLVANSRKYTPPGGKINAKLIDEGRELHFHIQDNGIGIPESELNDVIDFGYRASNTRDHRQFGGGFGLTKAYYLVHRLKGTFKISSTLGKGTKIDLVIPH
jgi:signal transduction histidine kinase